MAIVVYAQERRLRDLISNSLNFPVVASGSWSIVGSAIPRATCLLVTLDERSAEEDVLRVRMFRRSMPHLPLVLVLDPHVPITMVALVEADEALFSHDIPARLPATIERMLAFEPQAFHRIATTVVESGNAPSLIRAAVRLACESRKSIRVQQLTVLLGCSRASLAKAWREFRGLGSLRFEDLLAWLVLIRAVARKGDQLSWTESADSVGVSLATLERYARRLTSRSLGILALEGPQALCERFVCEILAPMCTRIQPDD